MSIDDAFRSKLDTMLAFANQHMQNCGEVAYQIEATTDAQAPEAQALAELSEYRQRYAALSEFEHVWTAIDQAVSKLPTTASTLVLRCPTCTDEVRLVLTREEIASLFRVIKATRQLEAALRQAGVTIAQ
jgi:ribosome-associated translation inhibitor RaiA